MRGGRGAGRSLGPNGAVMTDLFDPLDQGHQDGGLHSLSSLINDHHIKLASHLGEDGGAGEGQRGAHNVGLLQQRQLHPVTLYSAGLPPYLPSQPSV